MSSIVETLTQQLGGNMMSQISSLLGTDEQTAATATGATVSTLLGALSRNASKASGAESLHNALAKDHDGGVLDNLSGLFGTGDTGAGSAILGHVLGAKQGSVEMGISKASGLDSGSVSKLMSMLAPVVMGALGSAQREQKLDAQNLAGLLGRERQEVERKQPEAAGLIGGLLDTDGDGDFDLGDLAKHGAGMLGKLFK